jgi:Zn-dependent peptidase ImmA (M78 family)/DNA-binding XRE family transcriptional regulator
MVKALVKGSLLLWARKSAGLKRSEASQKINVSEESIAKWEADEDKPSISQLRKLSEVYKRPLAVFYLAEPPMDFQAMRDFRRRDDDQQLRLSPKLLYEIRQSEERREAALELLDSIDERVKPFSGSASISQDPEETAKTIRNILGVKLADQLTWKKGIYESFNQWRTALEQAGVLVFQATEIETEEAAGFSSKHAKLPIITVNIKDAPSARAFTLLHELAHLMLHQNSVCNELSYEGKRDRDGERIEVFCNHVAGAVLIPKRSLLDEPLVSRHPSTKPEWEDEHLDSLSLKFGASREVVLRRLLILGKTDKEFYRAKRKQYKEEWEEAQKNRPKGGFAPPHQMAISSAGRTFVDLVLRSFYRKKITLSDVSSLLGVRLKHLPKIERAIHGRPVTAVRSV